MEESVVTSIVAAVEQGHWAVLAGAVLTVLVWIARRMLGEKKLPAKAVPIVNAVIALAVSIADYLVRDVPWYTAVASGFIVGATAGGFWSMLGKHVLPLPDKPPEE